MVRHVRDGEIVGQHAGHSFDLAEAEVEVLQQHEADQQGTFVRGRPSGLLATLPEDEPVGRTTYRLQRQSLTVLLHFVKLSKLTTTVAIGTAKVSSRACPEKLNTEVGISIAVAFNSMPA